MPPVVRARAGSARQKRVKTSAASPGLSPTPWSRTVTATAESLLPIVTSTGRPSPCSIALETRLRSTRSMRRESISAMTGSSGSWTTSCGALARREGAVGVDGPVDGGAQVAGLDLEHGRAGVEARDLEQVGEQRLEAVELVVQQLGRARHGRLEAAARVVDEVARHPDGRQRGAQLVRHVGDEALLHPREVLELGDLLLDRGGHPVEGRAEAGEVVLPLGLHALVEVAVGEALGDDRGPAHRVGHEAGHDEGDGADEQDERRAAEQEGLPDEADDLALAVHRVDEVEAVVAGHPGVDALADDDGRDGVAALLDRRSPAGAGGRAGAATWARRSSGMKRTPTLPLSSGPTMTGEVLSSKRVSTT